MSKQWKQQLTFFLSLALNITHLPLTGEQYFYLVLTKATFCSLSTHFLIPSLQNPCVSKSNVINWVMQKSQEFILESTAWLDSQVWKTDAASLLPYSVCVLSVSLSLSLTLCFIFLLTWPLAYSDLSALSTFYSLLLFYKLLSLYF